MANRNDLEIFGIRILLLVVVLVGALSVLVPRIFGHSRVEIGFLPQLMLGFAALVLTINLHLVSQRKLLREVSTALIAATSHVDRLEQFSFIDPPTQLFNRRYLDQLFNQQMKWLNRTGKPLTLLLFEVISDGQKLSPEQTFNEAALLVRSNFRGSDYVVRNSAHQFLVLLPDTAETQAQYALHRLTDKVDTWNLETEGSPMMLRHELDSCASGGSLWEKLRELEERLRNIQTAEAS